MNRLVRNKRNQLEIKEKLLFHEEQAEEKCVFLPKYNGQSENVIALWKAALNCYTLSLVKIKFDLLKYVVRSIYIFPPKFQVYQLNLFFAELRHLLPDTIFETGSSTGNE